MKFYKRFSISWGEILVFSKNVEFLEFLAFTLHFYRYKYKFRFYFQYKTGEIGLTMSRTKFSKHILHKDIEMKLEEVGQ